MHVAHARLGMQDYTYTAAWCYDHGLLGGKALSTAITFTKVVAGPLVCCCRELSLAADGRLGWEALASAIRPGVTFYCVRTNAYLLSCCLLTCCCRELSLAADGRLDWEALASAARPNVTMIVPTNANLLAAVSLLAADGRLG
jgi:hypothetical protein